jgi:hypothetical protein
MKIGSRIRQDPNLCHRMGRREWKKDAELGEAKAGICHIAEERISDRILSMKSETKGCARRASYRHR